MFYLTVKFHDNHVNTYFMDLWRGEGGGGGAFEAPPPPPGPGTPKKAQVE